MYLGKCQELLENKSSCVNLASALENSFAGDWILAEVQLSCLVYYWVYCLILLSFLSPSAPHFCRPLRKSFHFLLSSRFLIRFNLRRSSTQLSSLWPGFWQFDSHISKCFSYLELLSFSVLTKFKKFRVITCSNILSLCFYLSFHFDVEVTQW